VWWALHPAREGVSEIALDGRYTLKSGSSCAVDPLTHAYMRLRVSALLASVVLASTACGDSPVGTGEGKLPFTVSGPLDNRTAAPVPEGARAVVLWVVSSGSPDYAYVYGAGTVDRATNRFTVTFDAPPPAEALNQPDGLGVGIVLLTTDATLAEGRWPADYDMAKIVGLSGQHAVIYLSGDPAKEPVAWLRAFRRGFNVGEGITIPGSTFDGFAPVSADAVRLIVDDLDNIDVVNWT